MNLIHFGERFACYDSLEEMERNSSRLEVLAKLLHNYSEGGGVDLYVNKAIEEVLGENSELIDKLLAAVSIKLSTLKEIKELPKYGPGDFLEFNGTYGSGVYELRKGDSCEPVLDVTYNQVGYLMSNGHIELGIGTDCVSKATKKDYDEQEKQYP